MKAGKTKRPAVAPPEDPILVEEQRRDLDLVTMRREARERMMAPLSIRTPDVPEDLRVKWFGLPPPAAKTYERAEKRGDTIAF